MKYGSRCQPLLQATIDGMIRGYNETPENFGVPADEVIDEVIRLVDQQMEIDSRVEIPLVEHQAEHANQSTPPWESKKRHDEDQSEQVGRPALDSNEEHKVSAETSSSVAVLKESENDLLAVHKPGSIEKWSPRKVSSKKEFGPATLNLHEADSSEMRLPMDSAVQENDPFMA